MSRADLKAWFLHLDQLRQKARLAQTDVAGLLDISCRTYITWIKESPDIQKGRKEKLRYAVFVLEQGLKTKRLPVVGHDRRTATAELRRQTVKELTDCYPRFPVD